MSDLTFRDATPGDAATVAEIYNASIAAGGATFDQELKSPADVRRQMASFGPRETILLLEHDADPKGREHNVAPEGRKHNVAPKGREHNTAPKGRKHNVAPKGRKHNTAPEGRQRDIAGWGIIKKYSDRAGYRFCCETAVYLRRDLTGRGLGTRIKLALIERCRRYGYHHLVAKILAVNVASIEYNQKLGYELVGTQREIGYAGGRWQDVVILQLVLDHVPAEIPPHSGDKTTGRKAP